MSKDYEEALNLIKNIIEELQYYNRDVKIDNSIYDLFDIIEKGLKTLEIIEKKYVNVCTFKRNLNLTYEQYKSLCGAFHNGFDVRLLTEEEFNLLKEMLK